MPTFTSNLSNRVVSNNLPSTTIQYVSQTFLGNLPNVSLTNPTPEDEVLSFNATTGYWVNRAVKLSRCTDVTLSGLQAGDTLFYNISTSKFENKDTNYFATKVGEAATSLGTLNTNVSGDSGTLNNYTARQINEYSFIMSLIL